MEGRGGEGKGRVGEVEENKAYERQRVQEGRRGGGEEEGWK